MTTNETHKEKMMRKKMDKLRLPTNPKEMMELVERMRWRLENLFHEKHPTATDEDFNQYWTMVTDDLKSKHPELKESPDA